MQRPKHEPHHSSSSPELQAWSVTSTFRDNLVILVMSVLHLSLHCTVRRSQWPCGLRCDNAAAQLLGMCVRVPPGISDWSVVQISPTKCSVSECDREASIMRRWPTRGCCAGGDSTVYNLHNKSCSSVFSVDQPMDRDTNVGLEAILSWWQNNGFHDYFTEGNKSEE